MNMDAVTQVRDVKGFERAAEGAALTLLSSRSVLVVGHIDADGITASSIASIALSRAGIEHTVRFVKKLDDREIETIRSHPAHRIWFVDLGSGMYTRLEPGRSVVTDHHRFDPSTVGNDSGHVNPHLFGLDGSSEVSGAGVTYLVAKKMDPENRDLSALAVIGAVGDFQDGAESRLNGYNRSILDDATSLGLIRAEKDVRLFGRQTRPLHTLLQYSNEPPLLPFLTGERLARREDNILEEDPVAQDEDKLACIDFLARVDVPLMDGNRYRTWAQLSREEKRRIVSALVNRMLDASKGETYVRRLIGEVYTLSRDLPGTPADWYAPGGAEGDELADGSTWMPNMRALFDAKEFATLLNACGRHDRSEVGMAVCLGDRGVGLGEAVRQQVNHREKLREALDLVKKDAAFSATITSPGGTTLKAVRYFDGQDRIEDTIVGIVAGMLLGTPEVPADRPIIAFAHSTDGTCTVKVSGRGTRDMTRRGLDLSTAMRRASEVVDGSGGGHNIAAGATVPEGREDEFLLAIDDIVLRQLSPST
jgi:single-stranded-DNA-specific exonuclease